MSDTKKTFWLVAVFSTLVLVPFLGETIFYSKGEPREAIVAVSILQQGNWVLPLNYGADIAYKPPFLYWMIAAFSFLLGGEVSEFSSRLPSAVSFLAMQLVVFSFFAKRKGVRTALLTSILLLTSFEVHRAAVACRLDMLQVSLIVISLCLLFRWDEKGASRIPWLAVLLMACASLTKGPVGSVFPCLIIGIYQLVRGRSFCKSFFSLASIGLLSLLPLGIWFWMAYEQGGQSFVDLMLEENTGRLLNTMSYSSHEKPLWYNFLTLIWGWMPWTLVLFISLFFVRKEAVLSRIPAGETLSARLCNAWNAFRAQSPVQLFTWLVIIVVFVFYCIPKSKRSVYLLPIYPFMAVLIAEYLLALVQRGVKLFRISAWIFASLALLITFAFLALRAGAIPSELWASGRHAAENIAHVQALQTVWLSLSKSFLVLLPAVGAVCLLITLKRKAGAYALLYAVAGCILCIFVVLDGVYQPALLGVKSDKHLAARVREYVPQGAIYSYAHMSFYCTNYYLNDQMRHFEKELPQGDGYVLVPEHQAEELKQTFGDAYHFEEVFLTSIRSCDLRDRVYMYKFRYSK